MRFLPRVGLSGLVSLEPSAIDALGEIADELLDRRRALGVGELRQRDARARVLEARPSSSIAPNCAGCARA